MSRKRLTAWVLVLAAGMAVRVGIAAPRASTAELRALVCCAEHCPSTPRVPMRPHRCCFVDAGATDPASATVASSLERPAATAFALAAGVARLPLDGGTRVRTHRIAGRAGPPPYLDTLRLRC